MYRSVSSPTKWLTRTDIDMVSTEVTIIRMIRTTTTPMILRRMDWRNAKPARRNFIGLRDRETTDMSITLLPPERRARAGFRWPYADPAGAKPLGALVRRGHIGGHAGQRQIWVPSTRTRTQVCPGAVATAA